MHFFLVIYVFVLFILFTNNSLFARFFSFKGRQLPSHLVSAFAFAIVLYFTYDYIHPHDKESMILFNKNEVRVSNEEENDKSDDDWVIAPPPIKEVLPSPPDFETLPIQCAANYKETTACCNQPPAVIPFENTCNADKPYCSGYIAHKQWGACQREQT
tara:strand:- start:33 stop:506 length:474 start_codon:yes stop_codon:yes gene_type:complete